MGGSEGTGDQGQPWGHPVCTLAASQTAPYSASGGWTTPRAVPPSSCRGGVCRCKSPKSKQSPCSVATQSLLSLYSGCVGTKRGWGGGGLGEPKGLVTPQRSAPHSVLSPELHGSSPSRARGI